MRTITVTLLTLFVGTGWVSAQSPFQGGYPYSGSAGIPGMGNRPGLSPYLGLLNNNNPGFNYYYFVRPGLQNSNRFQGGQGMGGMNRPPFFPTQQSLDEENLPTQTPTGTKDDKGFERVKLPPAGHATAFGNTLGYFGTTGMNPGVGGTGAGRSAAQSGRRFR